MSDPTGVPGSQLRVEEIRREHCARAERIGVGEADMELYVALAAAEERYDQLARQLVSMVEATSPMGWWVKFYTEHFGAMK